MQNGCAVKIVVSQNARDDLGQIWRFGAGRWSPEHSDTYANTLFAAIFYLADNPLTAPIDDCLGTGYRRLVVGAHVVFYRVDLNVLEVVRVLHQSRDVGEMVG